MRACMYVTYVRHYLYGNIVCSEGNGLVSGIYNPIHARQRDQVLDPAGLLRLQQGHGHRVHEKLREDIPGGVT